MSWSVARVGTKDAVRQGDCRGLPSRRARPSLPPGPRTSARPCRECALAAIAEIQVDSWCNGVQVKASGSRGAIYGANINLEVTRIALCLDAPAS